MLPYVDSETGEFPLYETDIRSRHPNIAFPEPFEPLARYVEVVVDGPPIHDPLSQTYSLSSAVLKDGVWVGIYEVTDLSVEMSTANLIAAREKAKTAAYEWMKKLEANGSVTVNGVLVDTTLADQTRIANVIATAELAGIETVDFYASNGWFLLSITELKAIAKQIALYIQVLFGSLRAHHDLIDIMVEYEDFDEYMKTGVYQHWSTN